MNPGIKINYLPISQLKKDQRFLYAGEELTVTEDVRFKKKRTIAVVECMDYRGKEKTLQLSVSVTVNAQ